MFWLNSTECLTSIISMIGFLIQSKFEYEKLISKVLKSVIIWVSVSFNNYTLFYFIKLATEIEEKKRKDEEKNKK